MTNEKLQEYAERIRRSIWIGSDKNITLDQLWEVDLNTLKLMLVEAGLQQLTDSMK